MILLSQGDARRTPFRGLAHLIYADPPTNRQMNESGARDRLDDIEYFTFALEWLSDAVLHLENHSTLVICCYHQIRHVYERIMRLHFSNLKFQQEIIWNYNFGLYTTHQFVPSHENILIYSMGKPPFNWQAVAIESQRQKAGDPRADARGRTPGTVWSIPRVPGNSTERNRITGYKRSCQPQKLTDRIMKTYTHEGNLVYDPFLGSGTMARSCRFNKRSYFGIDICYEYVQEAKDRLEHEHWDRFLRETM